MAVIQIAFKYQTEAGEKHPGNAGKEEFSSQIRCLVKPEVNEWHTEEDIVIDWGDPAQPLDAPTLALACRNKRARPLFGRSWVHYHRPDKRLTLAVDRLGLFPILLAEKSGAVYIAGDTLGLSQMMGRDAESDGQALLELLSYGQLLGGRSTLLNTIYLEAATVCTIDRNGLRHTEIDSPPALFECNATEDEALDALVEAVDLRFRCDPDTMIPLSGGLDSRLLLAAALAGGHRPVTFSFFCSGTTHFQIAAELAQAAGTEFIHESAEAGQLLHACNSVAQLGGGEVPVHEAYALLCPDLIARTRGTTLLTTMGAEVYKGVYYDRGIPGSEMLGYSGLKSSLLKTARRYALDAYNQTLQPFLEAFPTLQEELQQRLEERLDLYQSAAVDAAHYLDSIYLGEQMRRRDVAAQQLLARDYARSHPFLDADVLNTLGGLSVAKRLGGVFQRNAVARLNPKLAGVRWEKTMRPLSEGLRWNERYAALAAYFGMSPQHQRQHKNCLNQMADWLEHFKNNSEVLYQVLDAHGLSETEARAGITKLLCPESVEGLHSLGVLGAYSTWVNFLSHQRAALAA